MNFIPIHNAQPETDDDTDDDSHMGSGIERNDRGGSADEREDNAERNTGR